MALSKRDSSIAYAMGVMLVAYLLWVFGIEPVYRQYVELNEDLQRQEEQFSKNQKTLAEARKIEEGYKRVEAQFPPDVPDKDPADVFIEEVDALVTERVGKRPDLKPTSSEQIKGAKGYEMLSFPISIRNVELKPIAELLKAFDQRGYLVLNATLNRAANLDKNELDSVDITLARIVKPEEPEPPVRPVRIPRLGGAPAAREPS
ncbi:MAG: type II secretion system protein GspM [Candidatus Sumerlaeaceae bacterium]